MSGGEVSGGEVSGGEVSGGEVSGGDLVDLVEVRLVGFPLAVYAQAAEHNDELMREFALMQMPTEGDVVPVPRRLRRVMDQLRERFAAFTASGTAQREAAIDRGEEHVDVVYQVPPSARDAALTLGALLDEADEFCREGAQLLTLATPPDALAFRRWFLGEFVRQIDGAAPTPWPGSPSER